MIECSNEFIYYKRKNRKKPLKRFFSVLLIIALVILSICYYRNVILKNVFNITFEKAHSISVKCINDCILTSLNEPINYYDLIEIEKNSNGDIVLISSNSQKINALSRTLVDTARVKLKDETKNGIKIPWLAFSGISFLSGYGKEVNFKVLSVENVSCDFISKFSSVGINQTLHSIFVEIKSEIIIKLPMREEIKDFSTKVLISETVLVGKVPEIYLSNSLLP